MWEFKESRPSKSPIPVPAFTGNTSQGSVQTLLSHACIILEVVFLSTEFLGANPAFLSCNVFVKEKDVLLIFAMVQL